jgi:putative FmdB family regulatory protein
MPKYDYRCRQCGRRASIYQTYEEYGEVEVECPHCGSSDLQRLINRVRIAKSEDSRLDDLSDPSAWGDLDENDPRSMARMMRKMGDELGEEMPEEFDEVVGRLEAGESPEQIEESMPDLGTGDEFGP